MSSNNTDSPDTTNKQATGVVSGTLASLSSSHISLSKELTGWQQNTMSLPLTTLSSLLTLQESEDHKPRLSKISWLPDIFVFRASIMPTVIGPVLVITAWSGLVAAVSVWWGKEVGLTNSVGKSRFTIHGG